MVQATKWDIIISADTREAINLNIGKSCKTLLRVKYADESDWVNHIIWMVPGWKPTDIWREAYSWIREQDNFYYALSRNHPEVEEVQIKDFKLV